MCLNESWSPDFWKVSSVVAIFKNSLERTATKNYRLISLLFVVNEFFEKLVDNMLVDHREKFGSLLISSMVSGLPIQPHTFWKLNVIELLGLWICLGLLKLQHLIYLTILTGFDTLGFFDKLRSYGVPNRVFRFIWYFVSNSLLMLQVVLNVNSFKNI